KTASDAFHTAASGTHHHRSALPHRAAIVAADAADAAALIRESLDADFNMGTAPDRRVATGNLVRGCIDQNAQHRKIVFAFPGQGSQYIGMGADLYAHSTIVRETLDACAAACESVLGCDLRDVMFDLGDASRHRLQQTRFTQPATVALEIAIARLWQHFGLQPDVVVGHSIGEFAAAHVAGVFSLEDTMRLVAHRGRLVQTLPHGAMLSVRLSADELQERIQSWQRDACVAVINSPMSCVLAGPGAVLDIIEGQFKSESIACRRLHTSHAFHSSMMDPIIEPFRNLVRQTKLDNPRIPMVSTVTGRVVDAASVTDPDYWGQHLRRPVQFSAAVQQIWSDDPQAIFLETGPRDVLVRLAGMQMTQRDQQLAIASLADSSADHAEWAAMLTAWSRLRIAGRKLDYGAVDSG
ncbi:MAG: acyltransferase domain-containing protein, partial [Planctomycetota bacterium]